MRLYQAMAGAAVGGAEAFFIRLALAFQRADGIEQKLAIRAHGKRAQALSGGKVDFTQMRFGGPLDMVTPMRLKRDINAFKPDVVLTWMNRATRVCPSGDYVRAGRLGGYYDLKYYQGCKHLIGNTMDIVDYLIKSGWPKDRAHYLPNFVRDDQMPPIPKRELFTPPEAPLILAMGRLHENKAFDVLLRALAHLPDAYLWLAGDGPLRRKLEALAEEVGVKPRVRFLGWRDDTPALLASCDVFVCPSRHEPLGNVVLEAWAQGRAVVAADSQGPGALIRDGVNGLLVPLENPDAMAHSIRTLLRDKAFRDAVAKGGLENHRANFTESIVVERYKTLFRDIAEKDG